ncbi:Peptidase M13 domain containing protein [Asbolus verrucosus]|uniref:Peptidase M13 domain containing protein n=1 Tax=Asbolus verrucosus TaxID=1661398 RepID=A0A482VEZ7_ASBVE|nr:Peptidase M13 domain containing protein [Asbolus verrucosus]
MQNRLIVPAPILHGSLYDEDRPKYLNFGSLGSVIGRGLVQSFLDQLKEHDNIEEIWSHKDYKVFENGTKCFEDDYSRNWKEESSRNASEVIQEVISEVIGRDLAYVAYQKWREGNEEDAASTLLSTYNPNQLFWIKASLSNCYKKLIDEDDGEEESAIAKYRNILSARHSAHFGNDFNCSSGSPMNPKNSAKCWSFL